MSEFGDRELMEVAVRSIEPSSDPTDLLVGASVEVILKHATGPGYGPSLTFEFGFPIDPDETLASIRKRAIVQALGLARRVAAEDLESFLRVANTPPEDF